jgi:hypothetical protein
MSARQFTIAMGNEIHTGNYDPPKLLPTNSGTEWLIVRRFGEQGQFIEISDTTSNGQPAVFQRPMPSAAPEGLQPNNSMLGLLLREHGDTQATFLLSRRNVDKLGLSGRFFPADGYCELSVKEGRWVISASGRHAHVAEGEHKGQDIPDPKDGEGMSWHFDATSVYWSHQVI